MTPAHPLPVLDDTGDVIMMDIDDPSTVLAISEDLSKQRKSVPLSRTQQPFDQLRQILPSDVTGLFIVDTNFAISHLSIIKGLVDSYNASKALVLIPWVVVQELDGLKSASSDYGQANLATLARNAVRYIYECLKSSLIGLRGQKMNECLAAGEFGDDAILDCARYWHEKQDLKSVLLSNDRNLCTKIMIHGMPSISHEPGLSATIILKRITTLWNQQPHNKVIAAQAMNMMQELAHDDGAADEMEVDEFSEEIRVHDYSSSSSTHPGANHRGQQTDMVIAPLFDPKSTAPDPFATLAAKAGISRFETSPRASFSQTDTPGQRRRGSLASKGPTETHSPVSSRSRSYSPDALYPGHYDGASSEQGRVKETGTSTNSLASVTATIQDVLRDLEATMIAALPALIRRQMIRELNDTDSVDFLLQDEMTTTEAIATTISKNWFVCFGHLFPEQKKSDGAQLQTLASNLQKLLFSSVPSTAQANKVVRGWIEVWRRLSLHDVVTVKYKQRQEKRIAYWQKHLES